MARAKQATTTRARKPKHTKAQTSPDRFYEGAVRVLEGSGRYGAKPWPFDYHRAMFQLQSWIYRCVMGNAEAAASQPLKLYVRKLSVAQMKARGFSRPLHTRRAVSRRQKRYLMGDLGHRPSAGVNQKLMDFGGEFEEVTDHPIIRLLRTVNPYMNGHEFAVFRFASLECTGNYYVHPVLGATLGKPVPTTLWPMPPNWVKVIPGGAKYGKLIRGYTFGQTSREEEVFQPDEVGHAKYPNPRELIYGLGKIEAGWSSLNLQNSQRVADIAFFDNYCRPDYALIAKPGTTPEQLDRFENKVKGLLRGTQNAGKFLTISGDVSLTPLQFPPKDIGDRPEIVEEIAAVIGYPITKLKGNDPNRANAEQGDAGWMKDTVLPMLKTDEEFLNAWLLPMFGIEDDAVLAYDDPVPTNRAFELQESVQLVSNGILTINEDRSERGLEPIDGGDVPRVNGTPLDMVGVSLGLPFSLSGGATPAASPREAGGEATDPAAPPDLSDVVREAVKAALSEVITKTAERVEPANNKTGGDDGMEGPVVDVVAEASGDTSPDAVRHDGAGQGAGDQQEPAGDLGPDDGGTAGERLDAGDGGAEGTAISHRSLMLDGCGCDHTKASEGEPLALAPDSPAVQLMETLRRVFAEQEAQVLAALNVTEGKATPRRKMSRSDVERALDRLRATQDAIAAAIQDTITTMFQVGGAAALTRIGLDAAFDVFNPRVADAIRHYTVRLAGEVNAVSISKLSETMAQGLEAGETIRELSSRVKDTFNNFSAVRAENIARTESARAYVEGEVAGWESSGVVQGKRWLLAPNACEFCEAAAAMFAERTVALREAFFKQGETLVGSKGGVMKLDYSDVTGPPLHPQCRCDLIAVTE